MWRWWPMGPRVGLWFLKHDQNYHRLDFRRGKVPIINVSRIENDFIFDISLDKKDGLKQRLEIQKMQNGLPEFKY